jgi:hypothetical protein
MKEFVPTHYRYETVQDAVQKISQEIAEWTPDKAEQAKTIADRFSLAHFSENFMRLYSKFFD